jgi:hypothetical protein
MSDGDKKKFYKIRRAKVQDRLEREKKNLLFRGHTFAALKLFILNILR